MTAEVSAWINATLIGPDGYFHPTGFACSRPLYATSLGGSFILSVIDGSAQPAPFRGLEGRSRYGELVRTLRRVSGGEPAHWFYGTDPDNALSLLSWVRPCHDGHALDHPLTSFETEPAVQGGSSWLGLMGESRQWLLVHEHDPEESFRITLHGSQGFCDAVAAALCL